MYQPFEELNEEAHRRENYLVNFQSVPQQIGNWSYPS